jgi:hypothetical protein
MATNKWIQKVDKSIKDKGTKGTCTGDKFGSESCPSGSKKYNLANLFHRYAAARSHRINTKTNKEI